MLKPVEWIGSGKANRKRFPEPVQHRIGFAIYQTQIGRRHRDAKPLRGFGSGILEVVPRHDGDTFRAVCTIRFETAVYVLYDFQKKARQGIATPKPELDLVRRHPAAERHYRDIHRGG